MESDSLDSEELLCGTPVLLHKYSGIGQPCFVHSRMWPSLVRHGKTFGLQKLWKQNHPLKTFGEMVWLFKREQHKSNIVFKVSVVIQTLCGLQCSLGTALCFSCKGFWSCAKASTMVLKGFFSSKVNIFSDFRHFQSLGRVLESKLNFSLRFQFNCSHRVV